MGCNEKLLLASEDVSPPPLLAYCYAQRRHALQLDIDKCPVPLREITLVCHAALRRAGALAGEGGAVAVEQSPPKPDRPELVHARLTFPGVVVDDDLSEILKLGCARACAEKWPHVPLETWAGDVIDPQSRGARTHHSAKEGGPTRISRIVGVWDGQGRDLACADAARRAAFCPLRSIDTPLVSLTASARADLEAVRGTLACTRFKSRFHVLRVEGGTVHAAFPSEPPAAALERRVLALWEVAGHAYFRAHPFRFTYVYERLALGAAQPVYQCFTSSHHCPFREKEGHVAGHAPGPTHSSVGHLSIFVNTRGVELRCNAAWHTVKTVKSLMDDRVRAAWARHHADLFRGAAAVPPPPRRRPCPRLP